MTFFQLIAVLFGLCMIYVVRLQTKRIQLSAVEVSFWYSTWTLFIVFALFPDLLLEIADTLRFARVFDFLVVLAFMVLGIMVFTNYFWQRLNHQKLEILVRELAIKERHSAKKK